ncbi:glycosyl hydrolase [Absidia repens]|uniref:Glycosyl hydrolase n=1 Tax=Absidia repens TaxID=90262 RepID=A0A1X2IUP7_9FUNG|nr:glycosyl hydrolase [Absidia repens]
MPFDIIKTTVLGYALALVAGTTMADPFKSMNESFGKIETGYGTNDSDFMRYRTRYHFIAPVNWMNDPSAPYFDGQYYHLYYQHNPYKPIWGNMTWGHAISTDLLKWQDKPFALYPDGPDDQQGVFDGTVLFEKGYQDLPTLVYTAVSASGDPYIQGQEKQVLAVTKDNGDTWTRIKTVIAEPPRNLTVNGFRDPYLFRSPAFDQLLKLGGDASDSIYMSVSSGIDEKGGRLWLYHSTNWVDWEFRGPLLSHPAQHVANEVYYGNDGSNWEVASYYPLKDPLGGDDWHFATWGTQGGRQKKNFDHWGVWTAGQRLSLSEPDEDEVAAPTPRIEETMSGVFDWGLLYAQLMFEDTKDGNDRALVVGWVQDDLLAPEKNPGRWNGVMGLVRETFIQKIDNVSPQDPLLQQGYSSWVYDEKTNTVRTLGTRPVEEVAFMRGDNKKWTLDQSDAESKDLSNYSIPVNSKYVEIDATFHTSSESIFSIVVRQSEHEETVISYIPSNSNIHINRTISTQQSDVYRTGSESHPVPLFRIQDDKDDKKATLEPLNLRIFVDNSLVEVFANERMAVSTRIYPTHDDSIGMSLRLPSDVTVTKLDVYSIDFTAWDRP